jgi:acylphosphatase
VRNQRDGTLEVLLEGSRDAVENVIRLLHRGPSAAHVDRVDVEYQPASGELPPMRVTA